LRNQVNRFQADGDIERGGVYVQEEFLRRRRKVYGAIVLLVLCGGGLVLSWLYAPGASWIRGVLVLALLTIAVVSNLVFWRCPACGGHLGKLYIGLQYPKFCPNCGVRLLPH